MPRVPGSWPTGAHGGGRPVPSYPPPPHFAAVRPNAALLLFVYKTPNILCAKRRGVVSIDEGNNHSSPTPSFSPARRVPHRHLKSAQATWLLPPYFHFAKTGKALRNSAFVSPIKYRGRHKLIKQSHAKRHKSRGGVTAMSGSIAADECNSGG